MVVSRNKGTQYRPQNSIILLMGTPKKGTAKFRKPPAGTLQTEGMACDYRLVFNTIFNSHLSSILFRGYYDIE